MTYLAIKATNNIRLVQCLQNLAFPIVVTHEERLEEVTVTLRDKEKLVAFLTHLKTAADLSFQILVSICGVDNLHTLPRFKVVYHLLSIKYNWRLRLVVELNEGEVVQSSCGVYASADWYERETYDMFGIQFENHPDLRRLLTDYDFRGYPLRKDFPLSGDWQLRYDPISEAIIEEPLRLKEEFRNYDFASPWGGYEKLAGNKPGDWNNMILPGDEKAGLSEGKNK